MSPERLMDTLLKGIKENWPDICDDDITDILTDASGNLIFFCDFKIFLYTK